MKSGERVTGDERVTGGAVVYLSGVRAMREGEARMMLDGEARAMLDARVTRWLRVATRSEQDVRAMLTEGGLAEAEHPHWIERYRRQGHLDDERMAVALATRATRRGRGSVHVLAELVEHGLGDSAVAKAVAEESTTGDRERALTIAARRARQYAGLDRVAAQRRLAAFLTRRGFPVQVVSEVCQEVLDGSQGDDEVAARQPVLRAVGAP